MFRLSPLYLPTDGTISPYTAENTVLITNTVTNANTTVSWDRVRDTTEPARVQSLERGDKRGHDCEGEIDHRHPQIGWPTV